MTTDPSPSGIGEEPAKTPTAEADDSSRRPRHESPSLGRPNYAAAMNARRTRQSTASH